MFKYYLEVEYEEHMLYANEISGIYGEAYGVCLTTAKVAAILNKYAKKNGTDNPKLFYHTKWGLKRVYREELYKPAMEEYVKTLRLGG